MNAKALLVLISYNLQVIDGAAIAKQGLIMIHGINACQTTTSNVPNQPNSVHIRVSERVLVILSSHALTHTGDVLILMRKMEDDSVPQKAYFPG